MGIGEAAERIMDRFGWWAPGCRGIVVRNHHHFGFVDPERVSGMCGSVGPGKGMSEQDSRRQICVSGNVKGEVEVVVGGSTNG